MSKTLRFLLAVILSFSTIAPSAQAMVSPLSIAILPKFEFPPEDFVVAGVRANIFYGMHRQVYGLDLGLIASGTTQNLGGIQLSGLFNNNKGHVVGIGLQAAGFGNFNKTARIIGVQAAVGVNANSGEATVLGLQIAAVNESPFTRIMGFQVGVYNVARDVYGFQIGLVNRAENLHGIQIGLLNYHLKGLFYVAPILNAGF